MKINEKGLQLIKESEGLRLEAYRPVWDDPYTIGFGHTQGVVEGSTITLKEAEELLLDDLSYFEDVVSELVKVPLTANQFSALVSFVFNVGESAFAESTLLRFLNKGNYYDASNQFLRWDKVGDSKSEGLTLRRLRERELFLSNR